MSRLPLALPRRQRVCLSVSTSTFSVPRFRQTLVTGHGRRREGIVDPGLGSGTTVYLLDGPSVTLVSPVVDRLSVDRYCGVTGPNRMSNDPMGEVIQPKDRVFGCSTSVWNQGYSH